jgi:hypothetical protein
VPLLHFSEWEAFMARAEFFFTYVLYRKNKTKRIGKGGVTFQTDDHTRSYLEAAYPRSDWNWDAFDIEWHSNEGAAFKAERRKIDDFERATGSLPPWNVIRGGSGGAAFVGCKATLATGERCLSLAKYGSFCGVHG